MAISNSLKLDPLHEHDTYKNIGKGPPPKSYNEIRSHFVFDAKKHGRHKARKITYENLTDALLSSVCSGLVSLRVIRLVLFLAELNGLESWGTKIGN